jgi:hypothetical protein
MELMEADYLGPRAEAVAVRLACKPAEVRRAALALDAEGRAIYLRYPGSKARHLVPVDFKLDPGFRVCANCRVVFEKTSRKSRATSCSRACGNSLSWRKPGVAERRSAGIKAEKMTEAGRARTAAHNERRWSDPAQRERLAEWNRERWADPATKAQLSAAIQAVNGSAEVRREIAQRQTANWRDPAFREKTVESVRKAKRSPEARAKWSEQLKARWQDPVLREKYLAAVKRNSALAKGSK